MLEARPAAMAPRVNGFRDADGRLSMNAHQWLGIGAYASLVLGFYLLQAPAVGDSTTRLALEICYGAVALVAACAFVKAAAVDPADDDDDDDDEAGLFCQLCDRNVHAGSKHCRACDKCVAHFDHHCKWLNNCVGARNYHSFFALVATVLWQVLGQLCAGAWLLAWVSRNPARADALLDDDARFPSHLTRLEFQAALAAYLLLCVCLGYLVGDLFAFHVLLIRRGMTTYEYIVSRREADDDDGRGGGTRRGWWSEASRLESRQGGDVLRCGWCAGNRVGVGDEDDGDATGGGRDGRGRGSRCRASVFSSRAASASAASASGANDAPGRQGRRRGGSFDGPRGVTESSSSAGKPSRASGDADGAQGDVASGTGRRGREEGYRVSGLGGAMEDDDAMDDDDDFGPHGLRGLRPPSESLGSLRAPGAVGGGSARGGDGDRAIGLGREAGVGARVVSVCSRSGRLERSCVSHQALWRGTRSASRFIVPQFTLASLIVPRARRAHVIIGACRVSAASSRRYRARAREGCDGRPRRGALASRRHSVEASRIGNFVLGVNVHEGAPCRAAARTTARTSTSR